MTEERFTLIYNKIGKYFDMGIVDHETEEPFDDTTYEFHQCSFKDSKDEMEDLCLLLNNLSDENKQLKQFKSKVLKLLDEKIKHYEHKPLSAPVGQPMSVNFDADMDRIARLSELQHLRKELKE